MRRSLGHSGELGRELTERQVQRPTPNEASGRDIKELLKLTSKYCRRMELPLTASAFAQCAVFRGLACTPSPVDDEEEGGSAS